MRYVLMKNVGCFKLLTSYTTPIRVKQNMALVDSEVLISVTDNAAPKLDIKNKDELVKDIVKNLNSLMTLTLWQDPKRW